MSEFTLYEPEYFASGKVPLRTFFHHLEGRNIYTFLHWHQNIELSVTTKGRILSLIGNRSAVVEAGGLSIINNGVIHANHWVELDDVYEGVVVQVGKGFVDAWLGQDILLKVPDSEEGCAALRGALIGLRKADEKEDAVLEKMERLFGLMRVLKQYCIDERHEERAQKKLKADFREVLGFIDAHYQEPLLLSDAAAEFHYTPEYLSKLFRDNTGFSFHSYLQNMRLMHSLDSLQKAPEQKLIDCALENGFPNARSFIQSFKTTFGCTPSAWLKQRE